MVFAYNRPDHLRQTLEALAKNDLASESVLYVYCDGAKEWGGEQKQKETGYVAQNSKRQFFGTEEQYNTYLHQIEETHLVAQSITGFKDVQVIEREHNVGLADNIVGAVTEIVNQYERVIAFEDDIVCTRGTLTYLNDALELYKDDDKVMHISAYIIPHKKRLPKIFFYDSPYPAGGWATWKRAWQYFNPDTADHVAYWQNNWKEFDIEGQDHLSKQLLMNLDGRLHTWYIKWYSSMHRRGGLCLYPGTAMSNNIGWDDSGDTSNSTTRYNIAHPAEYTIVKRVPIRRNQKAFRMIRIWYSGHWYSKRYREQWIRNIKSILHI